MLTKLFKLDLQFFAEDPPVDPVDDKKPADEPKEEVFTKEYVDTLRREAAKYRTKAKENEQAAQTQQQELINKVFEAFGINPDPNLEFEKQLTAAQQAAKAAEQLANDKLIKAEAKSIGAELGIIDMDVAFMLADKESFVVKEDGSVDGVKEALEKVIEAKPFLVANDAPPKPPGYKQVSPQKGNEPKEPDEYTAARERARAKLLKK